jgi:outer membrane biosynthesis protein TonB
VASSQWSVVGETIKPLMNARRGLRWLYWPLIAGHCLLLLSGCTRAHAKTMPQLPDAALDVPPAPERDIEQAEVEAPPPPQPPAPAPESPRTQPPRPRPAPAREQPRVEPKPEPAPPVETPKPAEEPPRAPASTLQTTPATVEGELERGVRATLTRASNELNRIDYRVLNADARIQYDTAKRFVRQAEDAVKTKNLVFAKNLADKAATIADQLAGR